MDITEEPNVIFHIALLADWEEAARIGSYRVSTRGATLDEVGFIHASFEDQVAGVAARFYADVGEPLVVLTIDRDRLDAPVVVEDVDGGDERFPHIYGPVPADAVVEVRPATVTPDGRFLVDTTGDG
ncbi:MAG: DUF952 domain-containing protein [Acidimicrobiales bacterium]